MGVCGAWYRVNRGMLSGPSKSTEHASRGSVCKCAEMRRGAAALLKDIFRESGIKRDHLQGLHGGCWGSLFVQISEYTHIDTNVSTCVCIVYIYIQVHREKEIR